MECQSVQLDLSAYLQGELGPTERAAIESHLSTCRACAEEAALMGELGQKLRGGLADWVNGGVCPPEIMNRIEASIRQPKRKAWYQSWPATVGMVAAAAVLIVMLGQHVDLPQQMAALPLVGGIGAHLFPGSDTSGYRLIPMQATDSRGGITLAVTEVESSSEQLRVHYTLQGGTLDTGADFAAVTPRLATVAGSVHLRSMKSTTASGVVAADAFFDPVPAGTALTFRFDSVPTRPGESNPPTGPWVVSLHN